MSCYFCGKLGHKKQQCPERKIQTIKCYQCGAFGHYKNECPIILKLQEEKRLQILEIKNKEHRDKLQVQRDSDLNWINENIPNNESKLLNNDKLKVLLNLADIKKFIVDTRCTTFHLNLQEIESLVYATSSITLHTYDNVILSYNNNALSRHINKLTLDEFLLFVKHRPIFTSLSYKATDNSLSSLVYNLSENKVIKSVETESDREEEYYIDTKSIPNFINTVDDFGNSRKTGKIKVMRSRRHSTDWKSFVEKQHATLICETYDRFMNDGKSCTGGNIEFIYVGCDKVDNCNDENNCCLQ